MSASGSYEPTTVWYQIHACFSLMSASSCFCPGCIFCASCLLFPAFTAPVLITAPMLQEGKMVLEAAAAEPLDVCITYLSKGTYLSWIHHYTFPSEKEYSNERRGWIAAGFDGPFISPDGDTPILHLAGIPQDGEYFLRPSGTSSRSNQVGAPVRFLSS